MDKERFVERMLETENLTDELEDADADWLLNWGIARLDRVLQGAGDAESAGSRVNALMAVMRKISRIAGSYAEKDTQALAQDLADLRDAFRAAFPAPGIPPAQPDIAAAALRLSKLPPRAALEYLAQEFYPVSI